MYLFTHLFSQFKQQQQQQVLKLFLKLPAISLIDSGFLDVATSSFKKYVLSTFHVLEIQWWRS